MVGNDDGGHVQYAAQLGNALSQKVSVEIIAPEGLNKEYFTEDINIHEVDETVEVFLTNASIMSPSDIYQVIERVSPSVVHILDLHISLALALRKITNIPVVTTVHTPKSFRRYNIRHYLVNKDIISAGENLFPYLNEAITTQIYYRYSDKIIVHGENLKEIVKGNGISKESIHTLPMGDFSVFNKYAKGIPEEENTILYFGYIAPRKGLKYLLKAIPHIQSKLDEVTIIIAGNGDITEYEEFIDEDICEVHNYHVSNEKVAELFERASVVAAPYVEASQSAVIPVAYSFGKPVVATTAGSIPEIVQDGSTGYLIPPKNHRELAEKLVTLLKQQEKRVTMGYNGRKLANEKLSWENISEKTIEIYKDIY
ncbi:MAG: glycosyltransferase family 4 protein [Halopenitus sp.]